MKLKLAILSIILLASQSGYACAGDNSNNSGTYYDYSSTTNNYDTTNDYGTTNNLTGGDSNASVGNVSGGNANNSNTNNINSSGGNSSNDIKNTNNITLKGSDVNTSNDIKNSLDNSIGNVTAKSGDSSSSATGGSVGNVTSKSGDSSSTSKVGDTTSKSTSSSGSSSASNGNQSTNVTVKGNVNLPNYTQMGYSTVNRDGGSYSTSAVGIQGYLHDDGDNNPSAGVLVGLTIPVGTDRAKKAQDLAIEKSKLNNLTQLIQTAISLKQSGYTIQDTKETHELYKIMQSIK